MGDVFSKAKRSQVMAAIKSKGNKDTELRLIEVFRRQGIRGWRRHLDLPGRPDFTFLRERLVVFVDGCFWHGCPKHGRKPASNAGYWLPKLRRNKARDQLNRRMLVKTGWSVIRLWEHELKSSKRIITKIKRKLNKSLK